MKRPAFQFYPADWRKDSALQSCSIAAQGLWINLLCIAHECDPYGHLSVNGKPMQPAQIGRLVGLSAKECQALLDELEGAGVFSREDDGTIYSRRMVEDERIRNLRAEAGRLGGNPALVGKKVKQKDNQNPNLDLTPSSSSSSSSSENLKPTAPSDESLDAADPPIESIPLTTGEEFPIRKSLIAEFERLYPALDVPQTLREMRGWCLANPTRRKTKSGVLRFVNGWLAKEQNRAPGVN